MDRVWFGVALIGGGCAVFAAFYLRDPSAVREYAIFSMVALVLARDD